MKNYKQLLPILFFVLLSIGIQAQTPLKVEPIHILNPGQDPEQIDEDTLKSWIINNLSGGGGYIDPSTIKYTGHPEAIGRFYNGVDIGMDKGLILSNGAVVSAEPANNSGAMSREFYPFNLLESHGDEDLLGMYNFIFGTLMQIKDDTSIAYTGDAAAIEFTYIPFGDKNIQLDYVFASEEYPWYKSDPGDVDLTGFSMQPGEQIFDLWAISINERDTLENIALLPIDVSNDYERWVNLYNVNENNNSSFYKHNYIQQPFFPGLGTQFDALIVNENGEALTAKTDNYTQCQPQKVKIVIEDFLFTNPSGGSDGFFVNSAVFLKEKSLSSDNLDGSIIYNYKVDYEFKPYDVYQGKLIEDCNYIEVTITFDNAMSQDYPFPFLIPSNRDKVEVAYEDGTVISGDTIIIPAGTEKLTFTLRAVNLTSDLTTNFTYKLHHCQSAFMGGYSQKIPLDLMQNQPITFDVNPKIYQAYCKETIDLTVADVTNGGVGDIIYNWNNGIGNDPVYTITVGNSPEFLKVIVRDLCSNKDSILVKIENKPVNVDFKNIMFLCGPGQFLNDTIFYTNMPTDFDFVSVEWYKKSTGVLLGQSNNNIVTVEYDTNVGYGIWICQFKIYDICGGVTTGEITVNQTEMSLGNDIWICKGDTIILTANADGENYQWKKIGNPTVEIANTLSVSVNPDETTLYSFSMNDNCTGDYQVDTITVYVDQFEPVITSDPASAEICLGESITLTANAAQSWNWTPGNETTQSIAITPSSTGVLTYNLTSSSDYCIDKEVEIEIGVFPNPSIDFTIDPGSDACTGESITFDYNDIVTDETFAWDFDDGSAISNESSPTHTYSTPGTYYVNLHVGKYICENDTTIQLVVDPLPDPDFVADMTESCGNAEVKFTDKSQDIFSGATYEWNFGDGAIDNTIGSTSHSYDSAGLFTVALTISNTARCSQSEIKYGYITVNPNPEPDFEANPWITTMDNPVIEFTDQTLSDSTIIGWEWDLGDGTISNDQNPVHTYSLAQDYEILLRVETINGCWDTVSHKVAISQNIQLFIPNAFTPNGDGLNDSFEIKGTPITDFNLYIYDRWGSMIWSTHDFYTHWDGNDKNGNPVEKGTYVYVIKGTDFKLQEISYKGTVTVIR